MSEKTFIPFWLFGGLAASELEISLDYPLVGLMLASVVSEPSSSREISASERPRRFALSIVATEGVQMCCSAQ